MAKLAGSIKTQITIDGVDKLQARLRKLAIKTPAGVGAALFQEAQGIMAESKESFVPVDLGTLRVSGKVQKPNIMPVGATVTMGYGGSAAPYALAIHEHPSDASPPTWGSDDVNFKRGGPKYLEKPLRNAIPGMLARLRVKIEVFIRKTV